ncbi:MAG: hypothetical protein HYZ43_04280 [Flavobacteriia bacterium]|nr:hypothetical protein [Flavobacteriia bacterium]
MKKRFIFVSLLLSCITTTSFAQQQSVAEHVTPKEVVAIPLLNTQLEKIHQKESQIQQAEASSRAQMAQFKEELAVLQNDYKNLLTKEIATCSVDHVRTALNSELQYVEQQMTPVSKTTPVSRVTINPSF